MHVKLTYAMDGTIDVDFAAQSVLGGDVSNLLEKIQKWARGQGRLVTVERLAPSGAPLQEPEVLR